MEKFLRQYPLLEARHYAPKAYSEKDSKGLAECIVDLIRMKGHKVDRVNYSTSKGLYDLEANICNRNVKLKIQAGNTYISNRSMNFQKSEEAAGRIFFCIYELKGFFYWLTMVERKNQKFG